ncbi:MAG: hypothetical protein RLZZ360_609 [Candidatus Parcubacteria bacterium]|jgi:hypothetical protein
MRIGITVAILFALIANCVIGLLIYWQHQSDNQAATTDQSLETNSEKPPSLEKKILVADLGLDGQTPTATTSAVLRTLDRQLADTDKLYTLATAAGTVISETDKQLAWQRELYNRGGEVGLRTYIAELGVDEAAYRVQLEKNLLVNAHLEKIARPYITDELVTNYYNELPESERDEFAYMEVSIRETLLAQKMSEVRTSLLAQ